jgi:hypothetical protein
MMADIRDEELDALEASLRNTRIHHATGGGVSRVRTMIKRATAPIGLSIESCRNEFKLERVGEVIGGFGWPDVIGGFGRSSRLQSP